jgi:hypothetical protein
MAKNIVRQAGTPVHIPVTNGGTAKLSGKLIPYPPTALAGGPVALLLLDAAIDQDNVAGSIGGDVVSYACLSTDTGDRGTPVYFDLGNDRITTTASTHNRAGRLATPKLTGETTCEFIINCP